VKGIAAPRHDLGMKPILLLPLLFPLCWGADESAGRAAIEKVIAALNDEGATASAFFTADADPAEIHQLDRLKQRMRETARKPWSEVMAPKILSRRIRFVTPEVAIVDGVIFQYGSALLRSTPLIFVMRKQEGGWRIASLRILPGSPAPGFTLPGQG
jgi:hypothetical protein